VLLLLQQALWQIADSSLLFSAVQAFAFDRLSFI
jgi:hypothetical protein